MTKGQQHNSPLNIKVSMESPWKGQTGADEYGHAIFKEIPFGLRAAIRTLAAKWTNNKRTLRKICADWSPATDTIGSIPGAPPNNPAEYAEYVSNYIEMGIDQQLKLFSSENAAIASFDLLIGVIIAMSRYENSHWQPMVSDILAGMALYQRDFVEKNNA